MKDQYLELDPWQIIEKEWNPEKVTASESIFSLGNGAMGQRANFEEKYSGDHFQGSYVGGVYYPDKTKVGWWKNGYPEYFAKVLNAPNWIGIDVQIEGDSLDLATCQVHHFTRTLDMKSGVYSREFDITSPKGIRLKVLSKRFLSLQRTELGAIEYSVTPLEKEVAISFTSYIDGGIKNQDTNWDDPFWEVVDQKASRSASVLLNRTYKTAFGVGTYMANSLTVDATTVISDAIITEKPNRISETFTHTTAKGSTATLFKTGGYVSTLNHKESQLFSVAAKIAEEAQSLGFEVLLGEQQEAWKQIWDMADIKIEGDIASQQAIRFNIFQLNQTYNGADARLNIGPKGFTGEKYGGSTYWDTEAYCLPFYMATKPQSVARNLLKYRYQQLDKAIENAEKLGFSNGAALYPMVTMNGEECHNEWEITFEEIHRNGAIAFAIFNYARYTADWNYIPEMGLEVLIGIARFWVQRLSWSSEKEKYVMLGVTGPNEYENNINNNWYTNYLAQWCLQYTSSQVSEVATKAPKDYVRIVSKTALKEEEIQQWEKIGKEIYFPRSEKHDIFLQQDGFLDKEMIPVNELDPGERPLNQCWSWDRILRSPYIKQADTLQGFYLFEDHFTQEELKKHYLFYEPFTVHESSLSPCIHSILAARLDRMEEAYAFYLRTSRLDLDDYNKEVHEGLHITSMAGTWMSVVEGFGGLRMANDQLSLMPKLPEKWDSFSFKILFRGAILEVYTHKSKTELIWNGEKPLSLFLNGVETTVSRSLFIE